TFFFYTLPPLPRSTLFPYTTLFRSRPGARQALVGGPRGGQRLAPAQAPATRRRLVAHASVLRPGWRRLGGPHRPVRAVFPRRSGAPVASGRSRWMVLAVRARGRRGGGGRDRQRGVLRRALRPPIFPLYRARRRLPERSRDVGAERAVSARPPVAHRPNPRQGVQGGALARALRRVRRLRTPRGPPRLAAARCHGSSRLRHP